jgi:pyruvate dehydrogenase E2 component (dihydrolipoamide acetyltransferase)
MEEGRIGLIIKQPGEKFRRGETLLEVESDKTTVEVPALQDGILVEWLVASDQMVPVESAIARIEIEGEAMSEVKTPIHAPSPGAVSALSARAVPAAAGPRPRASTSARAAARRSGLDLSTIAGTGRNNRITRADIAAVSRPARASYHVESGAGRMFFREWPAQGKPKGTVLLIHGLFAGSQSFTTLGRKLAMRGLRCMAVDLPGHGETQSNADSLAAIVDAVRAALPRQRLHIIGHSLGGAVAAHLGDRAQSLMLLSPAGCGENINGSFVAAMLGGHLDHGLGLLGETIPPEAVAHFADHLAVHGSQLRAIASSVARGDGQTVSILSKLSALTIPVRAVFMRDDPVIPAHHALNLPANVDVRFMQGASHLPHWRDPELLAALVAD